MKEEEIDQYFENNFDCYTLYYNGANETTEAPAMTKYAFRAAITELMEKSNEK